MQSRNMANFELKYKLSKMWDETLRLHNTYCLEIEDSIQKLEILRKLEGTLKKLLCMVQQDRKFLFPETLSVLKQSIKELHQFNGDKAISAFEAINQYATNLLTKPWRKEFRTIKLHSGFYHLNIKTNLVNAEKLFEAMGYRHLSKDTMVLNGPLCPELVASVSRDAITACFELQIMQSIYVALYANGMTTSWLDIFCYRETHIGGISDAIVDLIRAYEKSSNQLREDNIGNCGYRDVPNPNNSFHSAPQIEPNKMMYQFPMPSNKKNVNTTKMYENSGRRYNANAYKDYTVYRNK
ncbi:protein tamozhennic [Stomoxys calcitrans]|uniref:protein tamozhennic n=1 Tax=Stomoxys calcitrans TaxID=35570 RepID=UPI0027E3816C|nr:protein tamozhennic [Stomoxys calcitrans]